jgi:hypothetical protein
LPLAKACRCRRGSPQLLPKSDTVSARREAMIGVNEEFFTALINRWRGATTKQQMDISEADSRGFELSSAAPLQPVPASEPTRPSGLLKRALPGGVDVSRAFQAPTKPLRVPEN